MVALFSEHVFHVSSSLERREQDDIYRASELGTFKLILGCGNQSLAHQAGNLCSWYWCPASWGCALYSLRHLKTEFIH